jgi:hypothetical protein
MNGLELDLEDHVYRMDGAIVPGMSEITTALGIVDRSYFTDYGRERGTAVHTALEYHLGGGLDWASVDERVKPYVEGAILFLDDAKVKPGPGTHVERPLFHPLYRCAGTPDLVCEAFGEPCVPDWKSGGIGEAAGLITAGYESMARIAYPLTGKGATRRRMAIQLLPTGKYRKTDFRDGFDYAYFQSAVSLYNKFILPRRKGAERAA